MDVKTFAELRGISPQRVRQLAAAGRIDARRDGRAWVIEHDTPHAPPERRPLSKSSQTDLLAYLGDRNLDVAPAGYRRQRLAQRVRELRRATNPAEVLRQYFANAEPERGPAGRAIVRAAKRGLDSDVQEALALNSKVALTTPKAISTAARDARMIQGLSRQEVASQAGVEMKTYNGIENRGTAPRGNLDGWPVFKALGVPVVKLIVQRGL